ncbi:hypothetical protein KUTeg_017548 [Tegillarca granosa]|uniref:AAA+ ATPase domain-containing protein n=1 Tax=Tegillarca granosa TaxID=220873 RepID=A0ABQ9EFK6_TEGGR|nr:hypothetical protein KUTeg_017548 [Tegillarca granosa]
MDSSTNDKQFDCVVFISDELVAQKCYMWPHFIDRLQCKVGDFIFIVMEKKKYICQVWLNRNSQAENVIMFSSLISSLVVEENRIESQLSPLRTSIARNIEICIVVSHLSLVKEFKEKLDAISKFEDMCLNLLYKSCVAEGFMADFSNLDLAKVYGISKIIIHKCDGLFLSEAYIVNKTTSVTISKVVSSKRFEQTLATMPISIGGLEEIGKEIIDLIKIPVLIKDSSFKYLTIPKGILLRGPPGTDILLRQSDAFLVTINGPEIFGSRPGETEENLNRIFQRAVTASEEGLCILFIDEIDSVCPSKKKSDNAQERRTTGQIITFLDSLRLYPYLFVIGATNRPAALDTALRRPGRFDKELSDMTYVMAEEKFHNSKIPIMINVPSRWQRIGILKVHSKRLPISPDVDFEKLADITNGYVGADLASVCQQAAYLAMSEVTSQSIDSSQEMKTVNMSHFMSAIHNTLPSIQKGAEGLVDLSPVYWENIGGLDTIKSQIQQAVEWPIKYPDAFSRMGLPLPKGVLLYGPPGCCKTTLVRAAATSSHATFLSLSGAQLYSPFVGDSERMISEEQKILKQVISQILHVFQRARASAPSILFLDEIDSIVGKRSDSSSQRSVQERVLSTLLNEMDGIGIRLDTKTDAIKEKKLSENVNKDTKNLSRGYDKVDNRNVIIVAATNRPDMLDDALIRPGRIDRIIYVPPPDKQARLEILKVYTKKMPSLDIDLESLIDLTEHFTGADLESLCREAALFALTENLHSSTVGMNHFRSALNIVKPSLTADILQSYTKLGGESTTSVHKVKRDRR